MNHKKIAPLLIIAAGCLWGTMGLFVRRLGAMGLGSMEIVELRSILAVVMLFPLTALRDRKLLRVKIRNLLPLACSGIFSIIFFNYCYFSTIRLMNLSAAAILLYTSPIFVMLLSIPLFHEKLTEQKVLALFMAFGGCCLVSGVASASQSLTAQESCWAWAPASAMPSTAFSPVSVSIKGWALSPLQTIHFYLPPLPVRS